MRDQLDATLARFEQLQRELVDPEVLLQPQRMAAVVREHGALSRVALKYRALVSLEGQIRDLEALVDGGDGELGALAAAELPDLRAAREHAWDELLDLCSDDGDADRTRCVMELRAGTGGDEAALFVRDLWEMYRRHAAEQGWDVEVLDSSATELGGFKEIVMGISGAGVYRRLRFESGGHRVQRVPDTETKGRIQTSVATVAVLPEPEDVEVAIGPDDYRKDLFCASGPGGQHVNKTASAVRLTHLETGIVVQCQDEKSQHKNLARALRVLKARIYEHRRSIEHEKRASERRTLVGSGDRSQRVRTYNFPQNRVTDHRINESFTLDQVVAGRLGGVLDALEAHHRRERRSDMERPGGG
ncbi:MAG: peptide chain release factor 1 [Planctomycetaceae bacterium]